MSFKEGEGQCTDKHGRPFLSFTAESLRALIDGYPELEIRELWNQPTSKSCGIVWVSCVVVKV